MAALLPLLLNLLLLMAVLLPLLLNLLLLMAALLPLLLNLLLLMAALHQAPLQVYYQRSPQTLPELRS